MLYPLVTANYRITIPKKAATTRLHPWLGPSYIPISSGQCF